MHVKIQTLQGKLDEQKYLLDQLRMWQEVKTQGINPDDVAAFALKEAWIPKPEQERRRILRLRGFIDPYVAGNGRLKLYNAVRLKDDSYMQLNPVIRRPVEA